MFDIKADTARQVPEAYMDDNQQAEDALLQLEAFLQQAGSDFNKVLNVHPVAGTQQEAPMSPITPLISLQTSLSGLPLPSPGVPSTPQSCGEALYQNAFSSMVGTDMHVNDESAQQQSSRSRQHVISTAPDDTAASYAVELDAPLHVPALDAAAGGGGGAAIDASRPRKHPTPPRKRRATHVKHETSSIDTPSKRKRRVCATPNPDLVAKALHVRPRKGGALHKPPENIPSGVLPEDHRPARGRKRTKQLNQMSQEQIEVERLVRLERNREAARLCRQNRKEQLDTLRAEVMRLTECDKKSQAKIRALKAELGRAKSKIVALEGMLKS